MNRHIAVADGVDDALLQQVWTHGLEAQAQGRLPHLPWQIGLSPHEAGLIRARWPTVSWARVDAAGPRHRPEPPPLLPPLHEFLRGHRRASDAANTFGASEAANTVLANLLASACFGSHHLWQDLGVRGRDEVSQLMAWGFPTLHASNHRNLRWKRHLFLELGERTGHADLRPPKCDQCDHFEACFSVVPASTETAGAPRPGEWEAISLTHRSHSS